MTRQIIRETFREYEARAKQQHGARFDPSCLYAYARPYFRGPRVRVRFAHGKELTGTIGVTRGWRPAFMLLRTARSMGSSHLLGTGDQIVAVWNGRRYQGV